MARLILIPFLFALCGNAQGLLEQCKPQMVRQADGKYLIRGRLFKPDGHYYGSPNVTYVGGGHPAMLYLYYTHYCVIPKGQAVAWSRQFRGGENREYVRMYWGTPNASAANYDVWLVDDGGQAQVNYGEDGYLNSIWVSGALQKTFRGSKTNDDDGYGWAPPIRIAPVKQKAPAAAVDAPKAEAAQASGVAEAKPVAATPEDAQKVAVGALRDQVVAALGKNYQRSAILSDKGEMETLVYALSDGSSFQVNLLKGVVTSAKRN